LLFDLTGGASTGTLFQAPLGTPERSQNETIDHGTLKEDRDRVGGPRDLYGRRVGVGDTVYLRRQVEETIYACEVERIGLMWYIIDKEGDTHLCREAIKVLDLDGAVK